MSVGNCELAMRNLIPVIEDGGIIGMDKKANRLRVLGLIVWAALMLGGTAFGIWWMISLQDPDVFTSFNERVASLGIGGWVVLLGIQYVQIVLAFIPGGPIQVAAGALYGPVGGLAVILVGIVLANATIFALVRRFGKRVLRLFVNERDVSKYGFLNGKVRLAPMVLLLFFIPGTPKDALTYIFALSPLAFWRFTFLSLIARMPGILVSVFAGDSIVQGGYRLATILFACIALLGILGYYGGKFLRRKYGTRVGDIEIEGENK